MKNKGLLAVVLLLSTVSLYYFFQNSEGNSITFPQPTTMIKEGEEEGNQDKRQAWLDLMHQAAPGTDWKSIELENSSIRHERRVKADSQLLANQRGGTEEEIIPGILTGEWKERGSRNNAGSVLATEYDVESDSILVVSAGGTLWRGAIDGSHWEVINQDLQFNGQILRYIDGPTGRRLIAQSGRIPHYSDDQGKTWFASTGIEFNDGWGATRHPVILNDSIQTMYLFAKPDYWTNIILYKSVDKGESFTAVTTITDSDMNKFALCNPYGTNDLYLLSRGSDESTIHYVNPSTDELDLLNSSGDFIIGNDRAQLIGSQLDTAVRFISYNEANEVFKTEDFGASWTLLGTMSDSPWGVGIYMSPSNPDLLITGGLNCHQSYDGGATWELMNEWWEYYGDIDTKLHADMMYFKEFENADGEPFVLISNHGGLNISWDEMNSVSNIGTDGLNVGQFYDVSTDPTDSRYIYVGSQDQGFQRSFTEDPDEVAQFEQVISGDYGHTVFTKNGNSLWTVYPGGWISYYSNPKTGYLTDDWEINSENESVWIPPLMPSPNSNEDVVYLAGGNVDGGPGSHIIRLSYFLNDIQVSQLPFDFRANTNSEVSALATSPLNQDHWYAATTNGRFFSSTDSGENWEQSLNYLPSGHYLYGATIYPSRLDSNTLYFGGSGYSNPPVFKSIDNGYSFEAASEGLPSTLVFEITGTADESMLFAATEAGPYVYLSAENQWYDLSGLCAPTQTYWSVEYLEEEKIARFGTYGRGIWDFQISEDPVSSIASIDSELDFSIYPNPASEVLQVAFRKKHAGQGSINVYAINGRLVYKQACSWDEQGKEELITIDISTIEPGNYIVALEGPNKPSTRKLVIMK